MQQFIMNHVYSYDCSNERNRKYLPNRLKIILKGYEMDKFNERSSNCELYARIQALPLTAVERERALSAMRDGAV